MLMFSNLVASKMLNDAGKRSLRPHSHRVILHLSKFEAGNTTGICKIKFKYWIRVQIRFRFQIMHSNLLVLGKFVIEPMSNQIYLATLRPRQLTQASFLQKNQTLQNGFLISVTLRWHKVSVVCKNQSF